MQKPLTKSELSLIFPTLQNVDLLQKISENSKITKHPSGFQFEFNGAKEDQTTLYFCISGIIKIQKLLPNGRSLFLYNILRGEWCNISFFNSEAKMQHHLRGIAETELTMMHISAEMAEELGLNFPSWRNYLLHSVSKMQVNLLGVLDKQSVGSLEDKIKHYLEYQKNSLKTAYLNISHQSLADELNVARESVSRKLKQLEEGGYLHLHRSKITLV